MFKKKKNNPHFGCFVDHELQAIKYGSQESCCEVISNYCMPGKIFYWLGLVEWQERV